MPKNMFSNFRYHLIVPFVKICDIHSSYHSEILKQQHPIETNNMLRFNGFETAAPYKGNVSANRMQSDKS